VTGVQTCALPIWPVIVYGTLAAVVYGAVLWLLGASAL